MSKVTACEGCVDWNISIIIFIQCNVGHSLRGLCGLKSLRKSETNKRQGSQPARAVWIEIPNYLEKSMNGSRHSLRGLCGLKFWNRYNTMLSIMSQPARAVWIEISWYGYTLHLPWSQPARAVWIEISVMKTSYLPSLRHSLRGLCELKFKRWNGTILQNRVTACEGCVDWNHPYHPWMRIPGKSQPARAVWIEIVTPAISSNRIILSQPSRARWFYLAKAAKSRICSKDVLNKKFFIFRSERCRKISIIQNST